MQLHAITPETCIVRDTAARKGRTEAIAPGKAGASRHLHYGRVILDAGDPALPIETGDRETAFVCLKGAGTVTAEGAAHTLGQYDAIYVPRGASVSVAPATTATSPTIF